MSSNTLHDVASLRSRPLRNWRDFSRKASQRAQRNSNRHFDAQGEIFLRSLGFRLGMSAALNLSFRAQREISSTCRPQDHSVTREPRRRDSGIAVVHLTAEGTAVSLMPWLKNFQTANRFYCPRTRIVLPSRYQLPSSVTTVSETADAKGDRYGCKNKRIRFRRVR